MTKLDDVIKRSKGITLNGKLLKVKEEEEVPEKKCTCDEEFIEQHSCPYQCAVEDNYGPFCVCCPTCEDKCEDSI